jgi:hypothetical protein
VTIDRDLLLEKLKENIRKRSDAPTVPRIINQIPPDVMERHYLGVCPHCHGYDGWMILDGHHYHICDEHSVYWHVGFKLFPYLEAEDHWRELEEILVTYNEVEAYLPPETGR